MIKCTQLKIVRKQNHKTGDQKLEPPIFLYNFLRIQLLACTECMGKKNDGA